MAAFYWDDFGKKRCTTFKEEMCLGPVCAAFCMLDKHYAYCGNTPRPKEGDFYFFPLNRNSSNFTLREIDVMSDTPLASMKKHYLPTK